LNMKAIFVETTYGVDSDVFIPFTVVLQILSWGLLISSSAFCAMQSSSSANEVVSLSLNNVWRGTQMFYLTAPMQAYSIFVGTTDYIRYWWYGEDISYWVGGDRGDVAQNIVKYWTLCMLLLVSGAWIWYLTSGRMGTLSETLPPLIIVTTMGLDVLHPCTFLWLSGFAELPVEIKKASWYVRPLHRLWWPYKVYHAICNPTVTGFFRWIGPLQQIALPVAALLLPTIGIHGAFLLVVTSKFA